MPTLADLSVRTETDGTLLVSSPLTRGRAAIVWFDHDGKPHVMWAVIPSYRNGLDDALILTAAAAFQQRQAVVTREPHPMETSVKETFTTAGWNTRYVDDDHGESGWFAYKGDASGTDNLLETGICLTEAGAIAIAMETWPGEFEGPDAPAP